MIHQNNQTMATLTNAIKKAEKKTGKKATQQGQFYYYDYKGYQVSFAQNGNHDDVTCIYTRKHGHEDDLMTDYFAGTFHDNITQAFNFIDRITTSNTQPCIN